MKRVEEQLLRGGLSLFRHTFGFQLFLRLLNFVIDAVVFRNLSSDLIGINNLRLGLLLSTIIFLSREAYRKACLSLGGFALHGSENFNIMQFRSIINVVWLVIPTAFMVGFGLTYAWLFILPSPMLDCDKSAADCLKKQADLPRQYAIGVVIYVAASIIELSTESFWLTSQLFMLVRERLSIEAMANGARTVAVLIGLILMPQHGLLVLATPQLIHSTVLFFGYMRVFRHRKLSVCKNEAILFNDLLPSKLPFDREALGLSKQFFLQGALKQLLTEGERYLISASRLLTFGEQGLYGLAANLGAIGPRLLFAPMDESCHLVFSQSLRRGQPPDAQDPRLLDQAIQLLRLSVRFCSQVALVAVIFAQAFAAPLMRLYMGASAAGSAVETVANLLKAMSIHVLICAINGPTEAFVSAAMSPAELHAFNLWMIVFSVGFLVAAGSLASSLGVYGFLLANTLNMLARVLFSARYLSGFFARLESNRFEVRKVLLPARPVGMSLVIALITTKLSENVLCDGSMLKCLFGHCAILGGLSGLMVLYQLYRCEADVIRPLLSLRSHGKID